MVVYTYRVYVQYRNLAWVEFTSNPTLLVFLRIIAGTLIANPAYL